MRTKKLVAATALAAVVAIGMVTPAHADATDGACRVGLVLPSKLAITSSMTQYGVRLTGDLTCYSHVTWDVSEGLISTGSTISFYRPNTSGFVGYIGRPTKVHALPRQGSYSFVTYTDAATGLQKQYTVVESGSNTMVAKYDSRVAWRKPKVVDGVVTLKAAASSINDSSRIFGNYGIWAKAKVRFQIKRAAHWKTVAVAQTDASGVARAAAKFKKGEWRAVTVDSASTWGRATGTRRL